MARAVYLCGFLFTEEEWREDELQLDMLRAWANSTQSGADREAYESFEVEVGRTSAEAA